MPDSHNPQNQYPLFVSLPCGTLVPFPDKIDDIPSLINWLKTNLTVTAFGTYSILFLADDTSIKLPLVAVTYHDDGEWKVNYPCRQIVDEELSTKDSSYMPFFFPNGADISIPGTCGSYRKIFRQFLS